MGGHGQGRSGLFDRAMDRWGRGERDEAVRLLRVVVAEHPDHADAHDHLGLAALDSGDLAAAQRSFQLAIGASAAMLEADEGFLSWSIPENRPYLRCHAHLALVFRRAGRWASAARVHRQLLCWSPNDDLGVRFLLGEEHHRLGELDRAISAHRAAGLHPASTFGLALALLDAGAPEEARVALLSGIALNRYVAPMLLGEAWFELPGRPGRTGDSAFAAELVEQTRDLWSRDRARLDELHRVWDDPRVRGWRGELDDLQVTVRHADDARRHALVDRRRELTSELEVRALAATLGRAQDDERTTVTGPAWVTDMRHLVVATDPGAALPEEARQLALHRGRIVEAITSWSRATTIDTAIACRRIHHGQPCRGHVRAVGAGDLIDWSCNQCDDSGRIGGWRGTPWDLGDRSMADPLLGVHVPTEWYDVLRNLPLGDARRPVARAVRASEGAELHGTVEEYVALADAAERAGAQALVAFLRGTVHQSHD